MDIDGIIEELFRVEYPYLLSDHDPDIERYFYLRSTGHSKDALFLYEARLRPRYPDDETRMWLLRCYRRRDPAFKVLLAKAYRALGERSLERIKQTINYIADKAVSYNPRDVYSTIRAAEDILLMLPKDRYEAVAGIERLFRYSQVLRLRERSMGQAANLVRSYLTDSLSVVEEELRRRENKRRQVQEAERKRLVKADWNNYLWQKKYGPGRAVIDFSSIVFSPEDLARIEIPRSMARIEDQVLAYCMKYWNLINDAAFERILFLYSRKYSSKNYDVYLTIRRGRQNKQRDDEILASVMSSLVTGYYYSIQGDRYLQRNWNVLKYMLQSRPALPAPAGSGTNAGKPAIEAPVKGAERPKAEKPVKAKTGTTEALKPKIAPSRVKKAAKIAPNRNRRNGAVTVDVVSVGRPAPAAAEPAGKAAAGPGSAAPVVRFRPIRETVRPALPVAAKPAGKEASAGPVAPAAKAARMDKPAADDRTGAAKVRIRPESRLAASVQARALPAAPEGSGIRSKPEAIRAAPAEKVQAKPETVLVQRKAARPVLKPDQGRAAKTPIPAPQAAEPPIDRPQPEKPVSKPRPRKAAVPPRLPDKPTGSVSDRLRELSGRSYDVYQDRFLTKVRPAIRKVLGAGRGLFFNLSEEAEDLVYNFLRDHYSDPYMNWGGSPEKTALSDLGYKLETLNPVIDECYRNL
jgi:hypothetical protein